MTEKTTLDPLSQKHRSLVFISMLLVFLLSLPVFIFYALGYRYSFFAKYPVITATGGIYVVSSDDTAEVFLDEKVVKNARIFRKAFYIQGLMPGTHHLHVQKEESHTWVKDLEIFSQIVTEVEVFNLPFVPQVRPLTEYTAKNEPVFFVTESKGNNFNEEVAEDFPEATITEEKKIENNLELFQKASSTVNYLIVASSSLATSSVEFQKVYKENSEYKIISDLFLEKAEIFAKLNANKETEEEIEEVGFGFLKNQTEREKDTDKEIEMTQNKDSEEFIGSTSVGNLILEITEKEIATTTKEKDNLRLLKKEDEVFVEAKGTLKHVPYYFCVSQVLPKINKNPILNLEKDNKNKELDLSKDNLFTSVSEFSSYNNGVYRTCRSSIKMDRQGKTVIDFDFFPENSNWILMHLEDGIYLTEVDDRSWQNSQPLYLGNNLEMLVYRGSIFVKEKDLIFEVVTSISK